MTASAIPIARPRRVRKRTPQVGDTVLYRYGAEDPTINGTREHPAIVCRVLNGELINVRVLTDGAQVDWRTQVRPIAAVPEGTSCWRYVDEA